MKIICYNAYKLFSPFTENSFQQFLFMSEVKKYFFQGLVPVLVPGAGAPSSSSVAGAGATTSSTSSTTSSGTVLPRSSVTLTSTMSAPVSGTSSLTSIPGTSSLGAVTGTLASKHEFHYSVETTVCNKAIGSLTLLSV